MSKKGFIMIDEKILIKKLETMEGQNEVLIRMVIKILITEAIEQSCE